VCDVREISISTRVRVWKDKKNGKEYERYIIVLPREVGECVRNKLVMVRISVLE